MKKYIRIIGIVLVIALIAVLIWFGNVMMGNPVSHALASKAAKAFLSDRFSGTDYQMERIAYSFKDGRYQDIYEEGLTDRIETAIEETAAYYAMLD